ncbi:hypothetical protein B0T25DRAFT_490234 [Lasiosphaeria hispida]|uniref:Chromo domain-containing protein n=1 Tax=Lasiosphaeria hispida TaxID=260671 RepID=A0AAJ0MJ18_9PEZI|nr:hypothetical protein B0T25DRAFT_490234 [Lasiosphaeria hispida]
MASKNTTTRRKTTIEIPLPSIKRYVPGSGPPPPRISLAPPRDSTAYIINQFILPPEKDTTVTTRRLLHYHIGFTDIPAAKLLIPANKILDYVSPRELEDWEYDYFDQREEEKARLALEKKSGVVVKGPGRPGKPSKNILDKPKLAPVVITEDALMLAKHIAGPSLSTPQKRKPERMLEDDEDDEETSNLDSDDAAIQRQLRNESGDMGFGHDIDVDTDTDSVDQVLVSYSTSAVGNSSRASSSAPILKEPPRQSISGTSTPSRGGRHLSEIAPAAPASSSVVSTPTTLYPAWAQFLGLQRLSESLLNTPKQNSHISRGGSAARTQANTHLPKSQNEARQSKLSFTSFSPASPAAVSALKSRSISLPPLKPPSTTPIPTPVVPGAYSGVTPGSSASKRKQNPSKGQAKEKSKGRKEKKAKHDKKQDEISDNVWVVKELLDDRYSHENGVKVHKYLVNWEGNWPPGQNPTWEPAENIQDDNLIAEYRRRKKAGLLKPDKSQKTLHSFLSKTPYANVAEAFEGELDELASQAAGGVESDLDDSGDELRVVDDTRGKELTKNGNFISPKFRSFDTKLVKYKGGLV